MPESLLILFVTGLLWWQALRKEDASIWTLMKGVGQFAVALVVLLVVVFVGLTTLFLLGKLIAFAWA